MNKLIQELRRLFLCNEQQGPMLDLVGSDGKVRGMVLGFQKAGNWAEVAAIHHGLQDDLNLPAPAVAVSGSAGYQLWLSLAEPVSVVEATTFLAAIRAKYLADMPLGDLCFRPDSALPEAGRVSLVPALDAATGKWSAFIDPTMGGMFVDEPGLEMAPSMDRQADMLSGLKSIKDSEFRAALSLLQASCDSDSAVRESDHSLQKHEKSPSALKSRLLRSTVNLGKNHKDPKAFLLAVMNDESLTVNQRIKAAKALLPYFNDGGPVQNV